MGNGPRLTFDLEADGDLKINDESSALSPQDLEDLVNRVQANMGASNQIFLSPQMFASFANMSSYTIETNPEYRGTPWSTVARMTKREHAVAKLHTTLGKLGVLKRLTEDNLEEIKNKSIRRLKRARWAKYPQKKA